MCSLFQLLCTVFQLLCTVFQLLCTVLQLLCSVFQLLFVSIVLNGNNSWSVNVYVHVHPFLTLVSSIYTIAGK